MGKCNCPLPGELTTIPPSNCPVDFKQIQKFGFRRRGNIWDATLNNDIKESAGWALFLAAADSTKIVITPFIGGDPAIAAGDAITEGGGDNSTLNGVELITGTNPSTLTARFDSLSPAQEAAVKTLMCENLLEVFLINSDDNIIADTTSTPTENVGIPIQSFFFSDRGNDGFGSKDSFSMSFQLAAGWSETVEIVVPNFSPLTVL